MILAKEGLGGAGEVGALGSALPCFIMMASASTSSAILMSSMSGADLRLSMWMRDRRVAVSPPVIALVMAMGVAKAEFLGGTLSCVSSLSILSATCPVRRRVKSARWRCIG